MRPVVFVLATLLVPATLSAQSSPCSDRPHRSEQSQHPNSSAGRLGFDPYNPTHAAIIRNYAGAALSAAPVGALLKLDPYNPTEAALLRGVGNGLPFWAYPPYGWISPVPPIVPCGPATAGTSDGMDIGPPAAPPLTTFQEMFALLQQRTEAAEAGSPVVPAPGTADTAPARGITIQHDGRRWTSAGRAVRLDETEFVRVGAQGEIPIYMRADAAARGTAVRDSNRRAGTRARDADRIIYVPTLPGLVAPFREVR